MDRRQFLARSSFGLGAMTLPGVGTKYVDPSRMPRAKRVVHICLCGGLSQLDSFDYKPALTRFHGKPMPVDERPDTFFGKIGLLRRNDWKFHQRGDSGLWVSELFPKIAQLADKLTVIRSMFADTSNHTPATFQENTGFRLNGFPTLGAWLSYGLGSDAHDLPAYVVIPDPRGFPAGGTINWTNGFLSAEHGGVVLRSRGTPVEDLFAVPTGDPDIAGMIDAASEDATRRLFRVLNSGHRRLRGDSPETTARERSYELAARMQKSVPGVVSLDDESRATRRLYGMDQRVSEDFGRSCLLARRLLERGVRFVQLFSGGSFGNPRINWDGHENMIKNHGREAPRIDAPVAGLLADLERRGMLDDTLVMFTSEFGRTPFAQSAANKVGTGRDHNELGFSVWLAGAGLRPGIAHGATDDFAYRAVEDRVSWPDFHATILHLLGIDHEALTFYHNGIQRRLTNVHGEVLHALLA